MTSTRTELLPFRCPSCDHSAHFARRLIRHRPAAPPAPYVCARCGDHAVPENMRWIALASLLFFAAGALGLSFLTSVVPLRRDDAFFLDIVLSIVFFQLFAHLVIGWRSVESEEARVPSAPA
jgi:hypothetical protein